MPNLCSYSVSSCWRNRIAPPAPPVKNSRRRDSRSSGVRKSNAGWSRIKESVTSAAAHSPCLSKPRPTPKCPKKSWMPSEPRPACILFGSARPSRYMPTHESYAPVRVPRYSVLPSFSKICEIILSKGDSGSPI